MRSRSLLVDPLVHVAHLDVERHVVAEEAVHVRDRALREVVADLVAGDVAGRADRAQQRGGERARADARLEHARAGEDVGEHEDRPDVLGVDHLRAARHLEHVLGERRAHRDEAGVARRVHGRAVGAADEVVVGDDARVRVELAAGLERHEVAALLVVDEQHPVARRERGSRTTPRLDVSTVTGICRVARARSRQNAHTLARCRRPALRARVQVFALLDRVAGEALVAALEEAEQERRLRARRALLDLVEQLLVAEVAVARRHRALLDDVVDAGEHAVRGELALAEPDERLHLAHEARAPRAAPGAGGRGTRRPSATRCRAAPRLRRRGCGRSRGCRSRASSAASLNTWRFDRPHAEHGDAPDRLRPLGTSKPYVGAEVDLEQRPAACAWRTRARTRPTRRSTRRCRARRTGRRRRSRARAAAATEPSESLPPDTATSTRSVGCEHLVVLDRPPHLLPAVAEEAVGAEARVVARGTSMTAGSRQRRHFIALLRTTFIALRTRRAGSRPRRRRCRRSSWVASVSLRITSTDSGTTSRSRSSCATLCGAGTSSSRRGLRNRTFMMRLRPRPRSRRRRLHRPGLRICAWPTEAGYRCGPAISACPEPS